MKYLQSLIIILRKQQFITIVEGLVFLFLLSSPSSAQWLQTNGPYGGQVNALAVSGSNIFAAAYGAGVFSSADNGTSWTGVNTGLSNKYVNALAVSGTNLFAGTNGGVFLSTDNGTSWTGASTGLTNTSVHSLAASASNLFAGTTGGVFLSTNNGASWTGVNTGLTNNYVNALAVSGTNLFAGTNGGVFLSTDNGTSWTGASTGLTNTSVHSLAASASNLFAGTTGGVFLSTNNGTSWTGVNTGLTSISVYALATIPNGASDTNVFAGTNGGGVFLSTNNGTSWTGVNAGLTNPYVISFAVSGTNVFAGTNGGGVFLSASNGTSWTKVNAGLTSNNVETLAVSGPNFFAGTEYGLFLSTNNGASWTGVNGELAHDCVNALAVSGTNVFAGSNGHGVFLSTDNGANWTGVNTGLTNTSVLALAISGTNLFAGTAAGIFLSTNNGTSWTEADAGVTNTMVHAFAVSDMNLFAGTSAGIFLSTNNGASWTEADNGVTNTWVDAFAISPDGAGDTNVFAGTSGGGVFLSTNNGTTWTGVNTSLTNTAVYALTISGADLFAGTGSGIFLSTNNGMSWANTGLSGTVVLALTSSGANLFAGVQNTGVWWRPLAEMIPPVLPVLISPGHDATNQPANLTLKISPVTGATGYHWQVSTNLLFSSSAVNDSTTGTGDTAHTVILNAGVKYYWHVQAINLAGTSAFSNPDSFAVMAVPATPVLAYPGHNAQCMRADTLILKWHSVAADTGYVCQLSASPTFSPLVVANDTTRDTTFKVLSLQNLNKYYWRVCSYNAAGTSGYTLADSFTTIVAIPAVPALLSPATGTSSVPRRAALKWNRSANATKYRLQVSTSNTFSTIAFDTTMTDTSKNLSAPLTASTKYYWQVSATDTAGTSAYSTAASFTTGTGIDAIEEFGTPKEYALYQNYPNPFNPSTNIRFDLNQASTVVLRIYNMLGQKVVEEAYGRMGAGTYEKSVTMNGLSSGVYIYKIDVAGEGGGRFNAAKKFLLLK